MGLSRIELWGHLGLEVKIVEPMLIEAYTLEAEREWRGAGDDSPHGARWHTSFHASAFPGEDPVACGRASVYTLMDLPKEKPFEPKTLAVFDVGTDLEHNWVRRFHSRGQLLTKSPAIGDAYQDVFIDDEHWLTGAADAIVLPPFWTRSHNVEIKTTSHEKVMAMRDNPENTPYSHAKYLRQIKTYIGLAYEQKFSPTVTLCKDSWAVTRSGKLGDMVMDSLRWCPVHHSFDCETVTITLEPPNDGTLIYSSREEPLLTASYYVPLDTEHMRVGREKLALWRDQYLRDEIPAHPHEGQRAKWTVSPCKYCDFKRQCKADYTAKTEKVSESAWIEKAKEIRPQYDFDASRARVLARWKAKAA